MSVGDYSSTVINITITLVDKLGITPILLWFAQVFPFSHWDLEEYSEREECVRNQTAKDGKYWTT